MASTAPTTSLCGQLRADGRPCTHPVEDTTALCAAGHRNLRFRPPSGHVPSPPPPPAGVETVLSVADLVGEPPRREERPPVTLVRLDDVDAAFAAAGDDPTKLALLVRQLEATIRDVGLCKDQAEQQLAGKLPTGSSELPGVGAVTARADSRRSWDDTGVAEALAHHVAGEFPDQPAAAAIARRAVDAVLRCGRVDWKVGTLREVGVDPDSLSETAFGRRRVRFLSNRPLR